MLLLYILQLHWKVHQPTNQTCFPIEILKTQHIFSWFPKVPLLSTREVHYYDKLDTGIIDHEIKKIPKIIRTENTRATQLEISHRLTEKLIWATIWANR